VRSGVTVKISGGSVPTTVTLTTSSTGTYATGWIPVGSYTITASKTGLTTQSKGATVNSGATTTVNFTM
jgi:iron complex outermembrane receptor protein